MFCDFGPIFEQWEADFGRTYVLGDDPFKQRLRDDLPVIFDAGRCYFDAHPEITGAQLFAEILRLTAEAGWEFGAKHSGHLVGEFPHERINGDEIDYYITTGSDQPMRRHDRAGRLCHWILEIHLIDRDGGFGGFTRNCSLSATRSPRRYERLDLHPQVRVHLSEAPAQNGNVIALSTLAAGQSNLLVLRTELWLLCWSEARLRCRASLFGEFAYLLGSGADESEVGWNPPSRRAAAGRGSDAAAHLPIRVCALMTVVVLLQIFGVAVPDSRPVSTVICLTALQLVGAVFAMRAARGGDRVAWRLVAAGEVLSMAANLRLGLASTTGRHAWFWTGTACGIGMYAAFAAAALAFPAQRTRGWQRAALAGEAVAVTGCGFIYVRQILPADPVM